MKTSQAKNKLTPAQSQELLATLQTRFEKNSQRHQNVEWAVIKAKLETSSSKLWSLHQMESTGGEPGVVNYDTTTGEVLFYDCSPETPKGRVSVCYDRAGWESRKEHRPASNAMDMAAEMGIELLTEEEYLDLQKLGKFDLKTSSWVKSPDDIRKLGGALYCELRYNRVFTGHNGAQSYYAIRGFRGSLRV